MGCLFCQVIRSFRNQPVKVALIGPVLQYPELFKLFLGKGFGDGGSHLMLSDDYEQEQEELRKKLLRLNEEITKQEEQSENIDRFISKVRKYLDLDELTPAVLNDMVKAVYVHAPDKSKGHREQQIDISYDLVEILPASLLNNLHNRETS